MGASWQPDPTWKLMPINCWHWNRETWAWAPGVIHIASPIQLTFIFNDFANCMRVGASTTGSQPNFSPNGHWAILASQRIRNTSLNHQVRDGVTIFDWSWVILTRFTYSAFGKHFSILYNSKSQSKVIIFTLFFAAKSKCDIGLAGFA